MTEENELEGQSRRKFLKTTGAVGAAATTGVAAFGSNAAAQQQRSVQISDITSTNVGGSQRSISLVTLQLNNIQVNALNANNVNLQIGDDVIDIDEVISVDNNTVQLAVSNVQVAVPVNVVVAVLGAAAGAAGNVGKFRDSTTLQDDGSISG